MIEIKKARDFSTIIGHVNSLKEDYLVKNGWKNARIYDESITDYEVKWFKEINVSGVIRIYVFYSTKYALTVQLNIEENIIK